MSNNEKLTLQDLIDLLSEKQGISKKDAENFLRELIALTSETITQEDFVRVKRFGTFKLTKIKARKSIDVNTNETIEIPAHYRLNFGPDKELRDAVNKPFAHYESVLIEEESPLNEEEETIDIKEEGSTKETIIESTLEESYDEGSMNDQLESKVEKESKEVISESVIEDTIGEKEEIKEATTDISISSEPLIHAENEDDKLIEETGRKSKLTPILIVCLLILIGVGTYWWYSNQIKSSENLITENKNLTDKNTEEVDFIFPMTDSIQTAQQLDSINQLKETPSEELKYEEAEIQYNDTMRKLGRKYYGHRSFWVYIYEENKSIIQNPNAVPIGTKLRIPPPSKYDIDPKNPESVKKAVELEQKLFGEFSM